MLILPIQELWRLRCPLPWKSTESAQVPFTLRLDSSFAKYPSNILLEKGSRIKPCIPLSRHLPSQSATISWSSHVSCDLDIFED